MEQQTYKFEHYFPEPNTAAVYKEHVLPNLVATLIKLNMVDIEQFAMNAELFKNTLQEVFTKTFTDAKQVVLGVQYHPPVEDIGHRYDIGLRLDDDDDRTFCVRIELLNKPSTSVTLH